MAAQPIGCRLLYPPLSAPHSRGTGDFLLFPFRETVSNVISTIAVQTTLYRCVVIPIVYRGCCWVYGSSCFRKKWLDSADMLTDMTPTAGQLYGAQIPAMTMNVKTAVSICNHIPDNKESRVWQNVVDDVANWPNLPYEQCWPCP